MLSKVPHRRRSSALLLILGALGILSSMPRGAAAQQPEPYLAVSHVDGRFVRHDLVNGSNLHEVGSGGGTYGRVAASPDGRRFYVVDTEDSMVRLLNVASLSYGNILLPAQPLDIAITPDGSALVRRGKRPSPSP